MRSFWFLALSWQFAYCVAGSKVKDIGATVTRQIRSLGFPEGSGMGIFFAIGIPVDIPEKAVTFSFYFEANYLLPDSKNLSETEFDETFSERSFNRSLAYEVIQSKLVGAGYPGRSCLLRSICEASVNPVTNNGLIGDIVHIIFTSPHSHDEELLSEENETSKDIIESTMCLEPYDYPSTSKDEDLPSEISEAENATNCGASYNECPISLLDLITDYDA